MSIEWYYVLYVIFFFKGMCSAHFTNHPSNFSSSIDTHWGQQVFHLPSAIPLLADQTTRMNGTLEMMRQKDSARLYNCRFKFVSSRRKTGGDKDGAVLMKGKHEELVYQIP